MHSYVTHLSVRERHTVRFTIQHGNPSPLLTPTVLTVALMQRCCVCLSVVCTECIVAKRSFPEQKSLLFCEESIGTKMNDLLTFA